MKFLISLAAFVAVAVAVPVQRGLIAPGLAGPTPIVDENGSPIIIGPAIIEQSPISVGPAIIEHSPISVGPAIIDFPLPDGGVVAPVQPSPVVLPSPVIIGDIPSGASPLVQLIVNVNQPSAVVPAPVEAGVDEEVHVPGPVNVVDHVIAPTPIVDPIQVVNPIAVDPIQVVNPIAVDPVQVVNPVAVDPVQVVEPVIVDPVQVAEPTVVEPVIVAPIITPVIIPDILN